MFIAHCCFNFPRAASEYGHGGEKERSGRTDLGAHSIGYTQVQDVGQGNALLHLGFIHKRDRERK